MATEDNYCRLKGVLAASLAAVKARSADHGAAFSDAINALLGEHFVRHLLMAKKARGKFWLNLDTCRLEPVWIQIAPSHGHQMRFLPGTSKTWKAWYPHEALGDPMTRPDHVVTVEIGGRKRVMVVEQKFRFSSAGDFNASFGTYMGYLLDKIGAIRRPTKTDEAKNYCEALVHALRHRVTPKTPDPAVVRTSGSTADKRRGYPGSVPQLSFVSIATAPSIVRLGPVDGGGPTVNGRGCGFLAPSIAADRLREELTEEALGPIRLEIARRGAIHLWIGLDELLASYSDEDVASAARKSQEALWKALMSEPNPR